jgi:hypothetical protein
MPKLRLFKMTERLNPRVRKPERSHDRDARSKNQSRTKHHLKTTKKNILHLLRKKLRLKSLLVSSSKRRRLQGQALAEVTEPRITRKEIPPSLNPASRRVGRPRRSFMRKA